MAHQSPAKLMYSCSKYFLLCWDHHWWQIILASLCLLFWRKKISENVFNLFTTYGIMGAIPHSQLEIKCLHKLHAHITVCRAVHGYTMLILRATYSQLQMWIGVSSDAASAAAAAAAAAAPSPPAPTADADPAGSGVGPEPSRGPGPAAAQLWGPHEPAGTPGQRLGWRWWHQR